MAMLTSDSRFFASSRRDAESCRVQNIMHQDIRERYSHRLLLLESLLLFENRLDATLGFLR